MIREDRIKSLSKEVGLRQSPIPKYAIVDADNQTSNTGLFFQDASKLVTIQNIKESHQYAEISDADFNKFIVELKEGAISEVSRKVTEDEKDFIQSVNLYPYEKTFDTLIEKRGRFVGFIFEPYANLNVTGRISWVELAFNEDVTFNVYLFNSNKPGEAIYTKEVVASAYESVVVDLPNWYIADGDTHKGGNYYFGYFEDDLGTAQAYRKNFDLSSFEVNTKAFYTRPVSLGHNPNKEIDVRTLLNESFTYGLNIGVEIFNDYTELLIRNKYILSKCIQLQFAADVLELILTSVRSNRNTRIVSDETVVQAAQFELYGNPNIGIAGIQGKLKAQLDKVKKSLFYKHRLQRTTLS